MASSDIIRIPMSSDSPFTTSITEEYLTTFNTTTDESESLLDGFDAMTIAGVVIGGTFMLVMLCLPFYCICTKSKRGWRKRSTTSGASSGKVYSSSEVNRRKSAGNVYSENESSGYKSDSDFKCSRSENDVKSESKDNEKARLKIENEKNTLDKNKMRSNGTDKKKTTYKIKAMDKGNNWVLQEKDNTGMVPEDKIVESKDDDMLPKDEIVESKDNNKKENNDVSDGEDDGENTWL